MALETIVAKEEKETMKTTDKDLQSQMQQCELSQSEDEKLDDHRAALLYGWRLYSVQFCLAFCLILSAMDSSVIATALLTIGTYFDDFVTLQWVVLAYLLTYVAFALVFSRVSDVVGRKPAVITALVILFVFSLGAGLSQSLDQVIAFRALQGVGGAGLYSLAFTTLPEVTPPEKFGVMSAAMGIVFTVSAVLGPTIGGVIATNTTWRWVFYFNLPCCAFVIALILISWPRTRIVGRIAFKELDLLGCVLFIAASVLLVFALQEAGTGTFAWSSATIICSLLFSGLSAIALGIWIWYLSQPGRSIVPLFHSRIIIHRILIANLAISTLIGYVFYVVLIELPERFQIVNGRTSQAAGIDLLPLSGASAFGSAVGGFLSSKKNRSFYTLTAGCAFVTLGSGLMYSLHDDLSFPSYLYGYEVLVGLGLGLVVSTTIVFIKLYAPIADAASAQGLIAQSRILGGNIGLALATIILNQQLVSGLQGVLTPTQITQLQQSLNVIATFTPAQIVAVATVFQSSFTTQMEVCTVLAGISFLLCALTWEKNPPSFAAMAAKDKEKEERKSATSTTAS